MDIEDVEEYLEGGYHPVYLGGCLAVYDHSCAIHKVGWGGFETIWLWRDAGNAAYFGVKTL